MVQIGDTLIEEGATRINAYCGTGQTVLGPIAFSGIDARAPLAASSATKEQIRTMRDIAASNARGCFSCAVYTLADGSDHPITVGICWGLFCLDHTDCEIPRAGLQSLLGACASVRLNRLRLIPFRQAAIKASDACVILAI